MLSQVNMHTGSAKDWQQSEPCEMWSTHPNLYPTGFGISQSSPDPIWPSFTMFLHSGLQPHSHHCYNGIPWVALCVSLASGNLSGMQSYCQKHLFFTCFPAQLHAPNSCWLPWFHEFMFCPIFCRFSPICAWHDDFSYWMVLSIYCFQFFWLSCQGS